MRGGSQGKRVPMSFRVPLLVGAFLGAWLLSAVPPVVRGAPPDKAPLVRFGVIADAQYCDGPTRGKRFYRQSLAKMRTCVKRFNAEPLDFVVHLGDLIDRDFGSYDAILAEINALRAPKHFVLGNHEFSVADADKNRVMARLGLDRMGKGLGYYDFATNSCRFIILNGNDLSVGAYPPGDPRHGTSQARLQTLKAAGARNATTWGGGLGEEQLAWLEERMKQADRAGEKAIVFCHFPIMPPGEPHTLWNAGTARSLLGNHPSVVAWMNGHNHAGSYAESNGLHHVNFVGMVDTEKTASAIVEVHADRLEVVGHGRETSRTLKLRKTPAGE